MRTLRIREIECLEYIFHVFVWLLLIEIENIVNRSILLIYLCPETGLCI